MKETRLLDALGALAENDRYMEAPPIVETRLILAFRAHRPKRAFSSWAAVCSVATAAALVTVIIVQHRPRHIASKPAVEVGSAAKAVATSSREATIETPKVSGHPVRSIMPKRLPKPVQIEEQTTHEVVTDFFPLMDSAPPFDRGEILHVQLPATAMQAVGLPVGDDHLADQVQADVLVGEEGLPRAIRFVKFEMK
jgi:hypothetical protein